MARKGTGYRAGMGAGVSISGEAKAGSSGATGSGNKRAVRSANRGKPAKRSAVKVPKVNLANEFGILVQKANTRSAVSGPKGVGSRKLPDNQAALTKKAGRHTR